MTFRTEQLSDVIILYNADCRDVLPTLGKVDAVVTDPPYGIKMAGGFSGAGGFSAPIKRREYEGEWDNSRPDLNTFQMLLLSSDRHIIWGGNYFTDHLPVSQKWLWWDKCQTMPTFSDGELAWTSLDGTSTKKFVYNGNGLQAREKDRSHPTQKPVEVMKWCLGFLPDARIILDPFMGSGTTGVACVQLGRKFIGIELEPKYFDIACKRISDELKRPRLPFDEPVKAKQEALGL